MKRSAMILPLVLLLCLPFACQDKTAMADLEAFKAQAAVEEQNKEVVRRYFELMDQGNPGFLELLSEDYVAHFPGGFDVRGRDGIKKLVADYFVGFPNLSHFFWDFVAEGDKVAMRYGDKGTHQGVFNGIPPTGAEMRATAMGIFRMKDGRMVEGWVEGDFLGMMQQLGMELKPKEAAK